MGQSTKTTDLLHKILVIADFVILNGIFAAYLRYDWSVSHFSNGIDTKLLYMFVNIGMLIGQYFYSNVIYRRSIQPDLVIRQVTLLTITFVIATFFVMKIILAWYDLRSPAAPFLPYFAPWLYLALLLSRILERYAIRKLRAFGRNTSTALFIGSDNALVPIYEQLVNDMSLGYNVLGYYADNEIKIGVKEHFVHKGSLEDLSRLLNANDPKLRVDEVYCSLYDEQQELIHAIMHYCNKNVIHFYFVPPFTHTFGFNLKVGHIGDSVVFTNYDTPLATLTNRFLKRSVDIVVASIVCLILLLILTPIIALIIKLQSPGPVFFRQIRTGLGGNDFMCYKFRSMHVNKDADKVQATENDPRKFAFGNFMRRSNIDELPQFFCVLKGDMSIVGPRPHMLHHTEVYSALIDKYMVRHFVKPGITGWAQVTGFRGETKELWQMEGRVRKDIWYIEHWTFWLDISIIFKTAKQIFVHDRHAY